MWAAMAMLAMRYGSGEPRTAKKVITIKERLTKITDAKPAPIHTLSLSSLLSMLLMQTMRALITTALGEDHCIAKDELKTCVATELRAMYVYLIHYLLASKTSEPPDVKERLEALHELAKKLKVPTYQKGKRADGAKSRISIHKAMRSWTNGEDPKAVADRLSRSHRNTEADMDKHLFSLSNGSLDVATLVSMETLVKVADACARIAAAEAEHVYDGEVRSVCEALRR